MNYADFFLSFVADLAVSAGLESLALVSDFLSVVLLSVLGFDSLSLAFL